MSFLPLLDRPPEPDPIEETWETTTRPSGEKPVDEPGWTPWEPLGVSPVACTFRRAGVVWRRRRIAPTTSPLVVAGTVLGLALVATVARNRSLGPGKKKP